MNVFGTISRSRKKKKKKKKNIKGVLTIFLLYETSLLILIQLKTSNIYLFRRVSQNFDPLGGNDTALITLRHGKY